MKVTIAMQKKFLRGKLASNKTWALKALVKIYENQTEEEKNVENTITSNGVGFNGTDGTFLTSLAKQFIKKGSLSDKQMIYVFKKIVKYWNQILRISDKEALNLLILAS